MLSQQSSEESNRKPELESLFKSTMDHVDQPLASLSREPSN